MPESSDGRAPPPLPPLSPRSDSIPPRPALPSPLEANTTLSGFKRTAVALGHPVPPLLPVMGIPLLPHLGDAVDGAAAAGEASPAQSQSLSLYLAAAAAAGGADGGAAGSSSEGEAPLPLQLPLPGLGAVHHSESLHLAAEAAATAADGEHSNALKKPRLLWSVELNNRFINALSHLVSVVSMSAERHLWGCGTWRPGQARPGGGRPRWPGCHGSVAPPCRAALVLYYCCRRA